MPDEVRDMHLETAQKYEKNDAENENFWSLFRDLKQPLLIFAPNIIK